MGLCAGILLLLAVHYVPLPAEYYRAGSEEMMAGLLLLIFAGCFWYWIRGQTQEVKRWALPIAMVLVALTILPFVLRIGSLGLVGLLETTAPGNGSVDSNSIMKLYTWGFAAESFFVDIAFILCLVGALLSVIRPSRVTLKIYAAGVICFWLYVAAYVEVSWVPRGRFGVHHVTIWDWVLALIGGLAAILTYSLNSIFKTPPTHS
jgi:hypothetical protein